MPALTFSTQVVEGQMYLVVDGAVSVDDVDEIYRTACIRGCVNNFDNNPCNWRLFVQLACLGRKREIISRNMLEAVITEFTQPVTV